MTIYRGLSGVKRSSWGVDKEVLLWGSSAGWVVTSLGQEGHIPRTQGHQLSLQEEPPKSWPLVEADPVGGSRKPEAQVGHLSGKVGLQGTEEA